MQPDKFSFSASYWKGPGLSSAVAMHAPAHVDNPTANKSKHTEQAKPACWKRL